MQSFSLLMQRTFSVQEEDILDLSCQDCSLDCCSHGNTLHGVDSTLDLRSDDGLDEALDDGHPGGSSNHDDLVDVVVGETCIADCLDDGSLASRDDGLDELLQLCPGEGLDEVLGSGCVCGDEGQVDLGLHGGGELDLRLLTSLPDSPEGHVVLGEVESGLVLEGVHDVLGQSLIHVRSTELGVSAGGEDLEDSVAEVHDGDIEGSSSEVEDHDLLLDIGLVQSVCECSGGGLVDDTDDLETCDCSSILGCLPLVVVEVCGDGDDRLVDSLCKVCLCILLDLLEDECGDLLGGVLLSECGDLLVGSHLPLDVLDGSIGVGHSLPACRLSDEELTVVCECYVRGERLTPDACSLRTGDHCGPSSLHDGGGRVASSEIDSDNS